MTLGLGSFMFCLPKFIKGDYHPMSPTSGINYRQYDTCSLNATSTFIGVDPQNCDVGHSSAGYLALFCISNMLMGIGTTPLYTLGAAYLDENVSPKNSPLYIGIWYGATVLGPSVGLASASGFLKQYTNMGEKVGKYVFREYEE